MSFWLKINTPSLAQGDWLPRSPIPMFGPDFGAVAAGETRDHAPVPIKLGDLIVMTQSCDLEQKKALLVACCRITTLDDFERTNPKAAKQGWWEAVRQGRVEGLHLLASPTDPQNNRAALAVDFRQIFSLPVDYLEVHARALGERSRLASPYLEHFSQAFARFFMRVGLPSSIPTYKAP
jgi:hypothetical protein